MWVSDLYEVKGKSEIDLGIKLKALSSGKSIIKFRITTNNVFIKGDNVEMEIR